LALLWLYHGQGLTLDLIGWLSVHGTTELFAILLAGGAGIHRPRDGLSRRRDSAGSGGCGRRRAAQVMAGVVFMLIVAALLEGFARQLVDITSTRLALGGFMLVFWCGYFFVWRRGRVTAEGQ
jgi:uncharacterized membrane protein SpoIIM required for sporulation